ncbi:MAG TPA: YybS family protein [Atribacterota bacterium]|nr:YybS family protein [Atribacterota bacterium]
MPTKSIVEGAFLSAITALLFLASLYIPLLGTLISFLCPLPIIILCLRHDIKTALLALFISFLLVTLLAGPFQGLIAVFGFGILGIAIGIAIKEKLSVWEILLIGSISSFASKIILMLLGLWLMGINPLMLGVEQIDQSIQQSLSFYQNMGFDPAQLEIVKNSLLQSLELIRVAFPAMLVLASVFDTIINYWVAGKILKRFGYILAPFTPFQQWRVGHSFFWSYMAGIFILIINSRFNNPALQRIGVNIQLLFSIIFLVTGLALVAYIIQYYKIKSFFFWVICVLVFMQPFLSLVVTWMGILDIWLDFRRLVTFGPGKKTD